MHARTAFSAILLCLSSLTLAQSAQPSANRTSKVSGGGCVQAGIEAGCFVLHDLHSGTNFNLFFKDNPPKVNTAIEFEGIENDNPNTCMQGRAVDVSKWTQIRLECPQPKPPECDDWSAWYNVQPVAPKTLHIAGTCTFYLGTKAKLVPRTPPPGTNPKIYVVDLVITRPKGRASHLIVPVQVHYSKQTDNQYDSVNIEPDHASVPVRIIQ